MGGRARGRAGPKKIEKSLRTRKPNLNREKQTRLKPIKRHAVGRTVKAAERNANPAEKPSGNPAGKPSGGGTLTGQQAPDPFAAISPILYQTIFRPAPRVSTRDTTPKINYLNIHPAARRAPRPLPKRRRGHRQRSSPPAYAARRNPYPMKPAGLFSQPHKLTPISSGGAGSPTQNDPSNRKPPPSPPQTPPIPNPSKKRPS